MSALMAGYVGNNSLFSGQVVRCVYPISGQYDMAPRYLYYFLTLVAVLERKNTWITTGTMGSIMTYSGVVAVHALAIASIRQELVPVNGENEISNYVTINGELDIPILPQAWDDDGDAVLAIVGVAYLVLARMQAYSSTFRTSEAKPVLFLWSLLVFVGMIAALLSWRYVDDKAFPQFRFCNSTFNDALPITKSRIDISSGPWNDTIWSSFSNSSFRNPDLCIYPCFSSKWALRNASEINILKISDIGSVGYPVFSRLINIVYILVASSGLCSLSIFLIKTAYWNGSHDLHGKLKDFPKLRPFCLSTLVKFAQILWYVYTFVSDLYARYGSIVVLFSFTIWVEWMMWYDPVGEQFRDMGQWGAVVAAVLVFIAAIVSEYSFKVYEFVAGVAAQRIDRFFTVMTWV